MSKQSPLKQFSLAQLHNLVLFDLYIRPYKVLPEWTWEWWQSSSTDETSLQYCLVSYLGYLLGSLFPLHRCCQCILQFQPNGWSDWVNMYNNELCVFFFFSVGFLVSPCITCHFQENR